MFADNDAVTVLSEDECWSLLSSMSLGRLVTILDGKPEIFPVNFATRRRTVLFRSVGILLTYLTQWLMQHAVPASLTQETVYEWQWKA